MNVVLFFVFIIMIVVIIISTGSSSIYTAAKCVERSERRLTTHSHEKIKQLSDEIYECEKHTNRIQLVGQRGWDEKKESSLLLTHRANFTTHFNSQFTTQVNIPRAIVSSYHGNFVNEMARIKELNEERKLSEMKYTTVSSRALWDFGAWQRTRQRYDTVPSRGECKWNSIKFWNRC